MHHSSRTRSRSIAVVALVATLSILAAACGARGGEKVTDGPEVNGQPGATVPANSGTASGGADDGSSVESANFGSIESPCGKGKFSVADGEQNGAAGTIQIGVPNDRGAQIRPGLQKPIWDASVAFSEWCNAQGGIGGLKIELIDMDAQLFNVETAMQKGCHTAFALVGGGNVQDDLQFSGKADSDFHKCGLIDIPAFSVSVAKSGSNGTVQPIPNPISNAATTWFADFKQLYPEQAAKWAPVWGNLPALKTVKSRQEVVAKAVGMEQVGDFSFPPIGTTDWTPLALSVIGSGAGSMSWTGESPDVAKVIETLKAQGWKGRSLLESNQYDQLFIKSAGPGALDGTIVRLGPHMLEESDKWPAVKKYLNLVDHYVDGGETALLGIQSMSAWLLFVTAANECGKADKDVLSRNCIMAKATNADGWTGGGLHGPQNPAQGPDAVASTCNQLLIVKDSKFERLYPKLGGEGDDGDGFHCPAKALVDITADAGKGNVDPSRGY